MAKINNPSRSDLQRVKRLTGVQKLLLSIISLEILQLGFLMWKFF
jgi:hypothetical protein